MLIPVYRWSRDVWRQLTTILRSQEILRFVASGRRLRLDNSGMMVVEFAMVAPPLMLLLLSIIDLGMLLMTQSMLDGAARDAGRLIRTGNWPM